MPLRYSLRMCANYVPVTSLDRLLKYFGVVRDRDEPERDLFPMGLGPFIRLGTKGSDTGKQLRLVDDAIFRFVPDFVQTVEWARNTYNVRSETVESKVTFKKAWADGQRCIIPAEAIYELKHEAGSSLRWRIKKANGEPMGIAGIYRRWTRADGEEVFSMSMLTVNADDHPFMKQFHAPEDEKRMVVILEPEDYEGWLSCPVAEAKERYCKQWHGELVGEPAGLVRAPKAASKVPKAPKVKPDDRPQGSDPQLGLF